MTKESKVGKWAKGVKILVSKTTPAKLDLESADEKIRRDRDRKVPLEPSYTPGGSVKKSIDEERRERDRKLPPPEKSYR